MFNRPTPAYSIWVLRIRICRRISIIWGGRIRIRASKWKTGSLGDSQWTWIHWELALDPWKLRIEPWNLTMEPRSCGGSVPCKKGLQPGCHLPNSPWPGMIKLFPASGSLLIDIPSGDGKTESRFLQFRLQWCRLAYSWWGSEFSWKQRIFILSHYGSSLQAFDIVFFVNTRRMTQEANH